MKAVIWTGYGPPDVLQLEEVTTPTPKDNEVLIKIHAAASTADTEFRKLKLPLPFSILLRLYLGLIKPTRNTILGTEFAGEVITTGKEVTQYQQGEQVFGYTGLVMGTYAAIVKGKWNLSERKPWGVRWGSNAMAFEEQQQESNPLDSRLYGQ